ncbi:MAG: hypothetical protein KL863_11890 [Rhizobium sp.]|nr:hypothetical protein [Rhizobium sp.]
MNSRPLLDYFDQTDDDAPAPSPAGYGARPAITLEERLKSLEARLRGAEPGAPTARQDLTLSAQVEAILRRRIPPAADPVAHPAPSARHAEQVLRSEIARAPSRVVVEPPPTFPVADQSMSNDAEFLKFSEAVYLIGQAARRFIEQPVPPSAPVEPAPQPVPSTGEIEALSAVLRETVSAFRSVVDDLSVSAAEIRHFATRDDRPRPSVPSPERYSQDEAEIAGLQDGIADLQTRLDVLLKSRRHNRY